MANRFALAVYVSTAACSSPMMTSTDAAPAPTFSPLLPRITTVVFDAETAPTLAPFQLMIESPESTEGRPHIGVVPSGLTGLPGTGNYTAYRFADLPTVHFELDARVTIPAGAPYSNSGIYLIYTDPAIDISTVSAARAAAIADARAEANARRAALGPGPFELDFFAHEVQIVSGTPQPDLPPDQRAGAIYNVALGDDDGTQQRVTDYQLVPGDTYALTVTGDGPLVTVTMRSIQYQPTPVVVTRFTNADPIDDPVRGGSPIGIALQIYYNDGVAVQHPIFEHIELTTW